MLWGTSEEADSCLEYQKFPNFYGTQMFISALTRACQWTLYWARCIQSI